MLLSPDAEAAGAAASPPEGWLLLGRCRSGTAGPGPFATGCHALAHPRIGIALIDITPGVTPNAEARLRRALGAAGFWSAFPGILPIWHGRIDSAALPELGRLLREGFATLPPLSLPGGPGWVAGLRHALAQDPAWDVASRATGAGTALVLAEGDEPPARQLRRRGPLLFLGFVASFWLGLAAGLVLVTEPKLAGLVPTAPGAEEPAMADLAPSLAEEELAAAPPPLPSAPEYPPVPQAEVMADNRAAPASGEAGLAELPLHPAQPLGMGSRPASRGVAHATARPIIDRACSQALFRFQQGEALSAAERVHLREGCATRR